MERHFGNIVRNNPQSSAAYLTDSNKGVKSEFVLIITNLSNVSYPKLAMQILYNLNMYKYYMHKTNILKENQHDLCVYERGERERRIRAWAQRGRSSDLQAAHPDIMQLQSFSVEQWKKCGEFSGEKSKVYCMNQHTGLISSPLCQKEARLNHSPLRLFYVPHGPPLSLGTGSV